MAWFRRKDKTAEVKYLIIGLGNIGAEYERSRHNIGFDVVDAWAKKEDIAFESDRLAFKANAKYRGKSIVLIKPTTYMNLSGKAVKHWMSKEKIPAERILVITDDLALPLAKTRLKGKGSHGGHNGLKDIILQLGHDNFPRLRFGVGNDFPRGRQVEHVLGQWNESESLEVELGIDHCIKIIDSFLVQGLEGSMNDFN